jgi:hypothetical protein
VLPDDFQFQLEDRLAGQLRVASARKVFYRLNLLTPAKQVFRYGEDGEATARWVQLGCRIGDFGPAMWSSLGEDYALGVSQLHFVRISFDDLDVGDFVELRNYGVYRAGKTSD